MRPLACRYSSDAVQYRSGYRSVCDWRGGVGGALLEQLKRQQSWLKINISTYVSAVLLTRRLCLPMAWPKPGKLAGRTGASQRAVYLGRLIRLVKEYHLLNPVIVAAPPARQWRINMPTSCAKVSRCHAEQKGQHLVDGLLPSVAHAAEKSRRKFLYDTNVGAGYRLLRTCKICSMLVMN